MSARTHTPISQMAGDGWLFLQNNWKEAEGVGVREESWECLCVCVLPTGTTTLTP